MITVHLIANAHLDPIWLWPWQAGLDAALATCRSACDRLDAHPDLICTRGEASVYHQIERIDLQLFQRIRKLMSEERWSIVNGWWIQPDCNLPSGFAMRKQIDLGRRYFRDRFGQFPRVAYNVDTFGHAATLPGLLREAGQDRCVMMRPQEHEMKLPARLFRWRGYDNGPEVVTFRIASAYNSTHGMTAEHVQASLSDLPAGVRHTMCFIRVGDHGGGPTDEHIRWCHKHEKSFDGCRLVFSSPDRFFDAIAGQVDLTHKRRSGRDPYQKRSNRSARIGSASFSGVEQRVPDAYSWRQASGKSRSAPAPRTMGRHSLQGVWDGVVRPKRPTVQDVVQRDDGHAGEHPPIGGIDASCRLCVQP